MAISSTVAVTPQRRYAILPPNHQIATTQYIKGNHQNATLRICGRRLWHPVVDLAGTGDVNLVVLVLVGQTKFVTTLDMSLPTSGDMP